MAVGASSACAKMAACDAQAERLREACGPDRWRGTVVVQGAGHASTLGNRVDLLQELRTAFGADFEPPLRPRVDLVDRGMHPGDDGEGWERGLVDRTYTSLDPADYTRMTRGGKLFPEAPLATSART